MTARVSQDGLFGDPGEPVEPGTTCPLDESVPEGVAGDGEEEDEEQLGLFGEEEIAPDWKTVWRGMPVFRQKDLTSIHSVKVHFAKRDDVAAFGKTIGQTVTERTRSVWFPPAPIGRYANKRFVSSSPRARPRYPIYVVSKGRFETRLTSDSLGAMGVEHFVVVEESERAEYERRVHPKARVIVLDPEYQRRYDTFDDLGDSKSKGPGPARNFVWERSLANGDRRHWVMDDNINGFYRLCNNLKTPAPTGAIFRAMEDFCDRYANVAMAGPNYFMFASRKEPRIAPYVLNTRIYSCNLIENARPYRWRGRYNEDTDLSLRMLLDGLCTVQFNAFLQWKITTQTLGGGNTEAFYAGEGTKPKSEMLVRMHPNFAKLVEKWGRWHHHVDYSQFRRNRLVLRDGVEIPTEPDDYGMELEVDGEE